jgi:digalactosyldiacylglycerol synthase
MELSPTTPTPASDLSRPNRPIWIVTTAALPWMTGTAINPLLRAKCLGLTQDKVTLVVPWLESAEDRAALYGDDWADKTLDDQRRYLQTHWLQDSKVSLLFYPAKYHPQLSVRQVL